MTRPKGITLQSLFPSDEEIRQWTAMGRTPETHARIRRWAKIEGIGMTMLLVGIVLLLIAPFASMGIAIWPGDADSAPRTLHWWIWGITIGVLASGIAANLVATRRRLAACYADGRTARGTVDRAIEHPGSGDDKAWWDLRISAVLPDGSTLRRRVHLVGNRLDRRVGGPVRFRHNTLASDAFDDVLVIGWSEKAKWKFSA